jgi:hypothetical protein
MSEEQSVCPSSTFGQHPGQVTMTVRTHSLHHTSPSNVYLWTSTTRFQAVADMPHTTFPIRKMFEAARIVIKAGGTDISENLANKG